MPTVAHPGSREAATGMLPGTQRILVVNSKGGCGKTTIATNLASLYASRGVDVALVDHDPQGSATYWLQTRTAARRPVRGVAAWKPTGGGVTRTFERRAAYQARRVVIDTPAGVQPPTLGNLLREADRILIPILPSAIDIKAGARFVGEILLAHEYRARRVPIAVVANRVRRHTLVYAKLERFLRSLEIPFVCSLRDTQHYIRAAEAGDGIFDLPTYGEAHDRASWEALFEWLERPWENDPGER